MGATGTVRSILDLTKEQNVTFLAASVAYYAFVSVIPLLLLAIALGSLLGGEAFAQQIVSTVQGQISDQGATVVEQALTASSGRAGASVAGIVALTWSGLKLFRGMDLAFDEVYGLQPQTGLLGQVKDGLTVLATIGLAAVLMIGLGVVLGQAARIGIPFIGVLGYVALIVGLVGVFLPLYYVMPPVEMTAREALPGAFVAAVGWLVLQIVFQIYAANAGDYAAYGLLGAVLLFLTWLYFAAVLVLVGAVVNVVLAGRDPLAE